MDPVTLIVAALVAGAASGAGDVVTSAIKDSYVAFKSLIKKKLSGNTAAEVALEKHERSPEAWELALKEELSAAGLDKDEEILAAAGELLDVAKSAGIEVGVSQSAHGTQIVQVANAHGVSVTYGTPPASTPGN